MKTAAANPPDVLRHLGEALHEQWRRYRKRLKACQRHFSEEAVHASRVETRRLLATVALLGAFIPEADVRKARGGLKRHLDAFDRLRDTQVQLLYVDHLLKRFAAATPFRAWLLAREKRFRRAARKDIRTIKTRRLGKRLAAFEKELRRRRRADSPAAAFARVQHATLRAFARVAALCQHVSAADTETIHRTRIAFKRFRYMTDALAPLLPALSAEHRQAMRGYQSMMGDIQDVEVLMAALDKFARLEQNDRETERLRAELARRRGQLIRVYLNAAGKLKQFWPPNPVAAPAATNQTEKREKR
jgi:CHAD domain-containing protein